MDELSFKEQLLKQNIHLTDKQMDQFARYYELLVEWNEKINLTAITEKNEVYLKHFYDSITPSLFSDFTRVKTLCDVGAGAGFPSLPLKICFPNLKVTIIDSLQKRIHFLKELVTELQLNDVELVHARAEDAGRNIQYRGNFEIVTARAVANMAVLSEYCLPLCRIGGSFIALKGANAEEELKNAKNAIITLGGEVNKYKSFQLPKEESDRAIIYIKKVKKTPKNYPRKAGIPNKNPLK